jgi:hypothetical protein
VRVSRDRVFFILHVVGVFKDQDYFIYTFGACP